MSQDTTKNLLASNRHNAEKPVLELGVSRKKAVQVWPMDTHKILLPVKSRRDVY